MVNYLATFSSGTPTSITLNNGGGTTSPTTVTINKVLNFTNESKPSIDDISTTEGSVIYLDISSSIAADIINYISVYNNWSYSIAKYTNLSFVFYANPSVTEIDAEFNINNTCKPFDKGSEIYTPYNNISFDIPSDFKNKITSIAFYYINNSTFDVSGFNNLSTLILRNCFELENIFGVNDSMSNNLIPLTTLDLSGDAKLTRFIMEDIPIISTLTKITLNHCDLNELPSIYDFDLNYLSARFNNFTGVLDLSKFSTNITHLNMGGNDYTDVKFRNIIEHDGINYGYLDENLSFLIVENNKIKSIRIDLDPNNTGNKASIYVKSDYLNDLMLYNIDNSIIYSQFSKLNRVYIDGKYFDKCSEISKYLNSRNYKGQFLIYNNYLDMDEQGLNGNGIYVNPQLNGNKILYDLSTIYYMTSPNITLQPSTSVLYEDINDSTFAVIQRSYNYNIDFNNIFNYCKGYDDEYIRQQILIYNYKGCILNIYNAQNLLNNPESTLYKAFTFAKGYFKLNGIRTNTPSISNFFPGVPIIFTNDPSEIPSIFNINLII